MSTFCSATFEQLLAFWETFFSTSNFEQLLLFWATFEQLKGFQHAWVNNLIAENFDLYKFLCVYRVLIKQPVSLSLDNVLHTFLVCELVIQPSSADRALASWPMSLTHKKTEPLNITLKLLLCFDFDFGSKAAATVWFCVRGIVWIENRDWESGVNRRVVDLYLVIELLNTFRRFWFVQIIPQNVQQDVKWTITSFVSFSFLKIRPYLSASFFEM